MEPDEVQIAEASFKRKRPIFFGWFFVFVTLTAFYFLAKFFEAPRNIRFLLLISAGLVGLFCGYMGRDLELHELNVIFSAETVKLKNRKRVRLYVGFCCSIILILFLLLLTESFWIPQIVATPLGLWLTQ